MKNMKISEIKQLNSLGSCLFNNATIKRFNDRGKRYLNLKYFVVIFIKGGQNSENVEVKEIFPKSKSKDYEYNIQFKYGY